jgi:hypothetical protein
MTCECERDRRLQNHQAYNKRRIEEMQFYFDLFRDLDACVASLGGVAGVKRLLDTMPGFDLRELHNFVKRNYGAVSFDKREA